MEIKVKMYSTIILLTSEFFQWTIFDNSSRICQKQSNQDFPKLVMFLELKMLELKRAFIVVPNDQ